MPVVEVLLKTVARHRRTALDAVRKGATQHERSTGQLRCRLTINLVDRDETVWTKRGASS